MRRFAEYACDEKSCDMAGGRKIYYSVITEMVVSQNRLEAYFTSRLAEDKHELRERIRRMEKNRKFKKRAKGVMALICAVMFVSSSAMVYAASNGVEMLYENVYEETVVTVEETPAADTAVEYTASGTDDGVAEIVAETEMLTRAITAFDWTIPANTRYTTGYFSASSGGNIAVSVHAEPTSSTISVGIIEPNGTRRYVNGKGSVYHEFSLNQTGRYRVFVENRGTVNISVDGSYNVW